MTEVNKRIFFPAAIIVTGIVPNVLNAENVHEQVRVSLVQAEAGQVADTAALSRAARVSRTKQHEELGSEG